MKVESDPGNNATEMPIGRVEGFSDGVFAIAITLLILEIGTEGSEGSLAHRLAEQWPAYVAYTISFVVIGIVWVNHHEIVRSVQHADHGFLLANLLLLFVVATLPFPTKVLGEGLRAASFEDQRTAALLYCATCVVLSVSFCVLWAWVARGRRLIRAPIPQPVVDARTRLFALSLVAFGVPCVVAWWSPITAVALDGALALCFTLPPRQAERLVGMRS